MTEAPALDCLILLTERIYSAASVGVFKPTLSVFLGKTGGEKHGAQTELAPAV